MSANLMIIETLREVLTRPVAECFDATIDATKAIDYGWLMNAALLMFAEADAKTKALFMLRVTARQALDGGTWGNGLTEEQCRIILAKGGNIDANAIPHLLLDGDDAMEAVMGLAGL